MATQITATLPTLDFPFEADYPTQEDWAAFSASAELNFGILGGSWSEQMQLWKDQANELSTELNTNATIAQGLANYQGDWVSQGYTLGQTVSVSGIYYVCKLTHTIGQNPTVGGSLYWNLALGNWNLKADKTEVALKIDKDMSAYTAKTTPVNADLLPLSDSTSTFGIKKLSWANLKTSLTSFFMDLTSNQTVGGNKNFTGNVLVTSNGGMIGYGRGSGGTVTQLTSKDTPVTLNTPTGIIIMNNSALAGGVSISFSVNNNLMTNNDLVLIGLSGGFSVSNSYRLEVRQISASGFVIRVTNIGSGSLSEALAINFAVIKGETA